MTIAVPARTYGDLILNPLVGVPGQQSVPATVSALANDGTFTFNYNLTQGNNFLTILASSGETITSTTITSRAGLPTCGKFAFRGFLASLRRRPYHSPRRYYSGDWAWCIGLNPPPILSVLFYGSGGATWAARTIYHSSWSSGDIQSELS